MYQEKEGNLGSEFNQAVKGGQNNYFLFLNALKELNNRKYMVIKPGFLWWEKIKVTKIQQAMRIKAQQSGSTGQSCQAVLGKPAGLR